MSCRKTCNIHNIKQLQIGL